MTVAVAILVTSGGCGDGAQSRPAESLAAVTSASADVVVSDPSAVACGHVGDRRCDTSGAVSECTANGELSTTACAAAEVCLGRSCVALRDADGLALDASTVRSFSDEGFVNAWSAIVGIGAKAGQDALASGDLEAVGGLKATQAICAADGYVAAARAADTPDKDQAVALLTGVLYSDSARELVVRAGTAGKLTLRVGDETISLPELVGREGRAWPDEVSVHVKVKAGANRVTALTEPRATAFYLRFRELDGGRPVGLAWRERGAACSAASLVDPDASFVVHADGARFAATPRFFGVVPRVVPSSFQITVSGAGKVVSTAAADVDVAAMRAGGAHVDAQLALPERGGFELRSELGGEVAWKRTFPAATSALSKRTRGLVAGLARVKARAGLKTGSVASFERQVEIVTAALGRAESDTAWVSRNVDEAEKILADLDAGNDAYVGRRGVVFRAYRSPLDGQLQPYVVFVPRSYDGKHPMPVVLVAHGRDRLPEHALRTLIGQAPDEHMTLSFAAHNLPPMPDFGAILVAPYGYANGSVLALGEDDVRAVLADLREAYTLDDQRISLTGYSLGGTVGFLYPLHAPGMFSASAPLCGYPNLMSYQSVANVDKAPWEPALLARKYVVEYAENGQYVPLHVVHGGLDTPGRSKVVVDRYRDLGYSVVFDVPEDADHNVWDDAYEDGKMIPWLASRRAPRAPESVRFVTRDYRYDRAFWLRVVHMVDSTGKDRAEVTARWKPKDARIALETTNVGVLALDLDALDPKPTGAITIEVGGAELTAPSSGVVFVSRAPDGAATLSTTDPSSVLDKHHDQSGALDDLVFQPTTIVVGTAAPAMVEANRVLGDHLARLSGLADVHYPTIDDVDASDDALAGRSVVLVGGPATNALTRALVDAKVVPLEIGPKSIRVGERSESGDDLGVAMVYPRPLAFHGEGLSQRANAGYVAVYAGLTPEATLSARMLPRYLPDWVVFDAGLAVERGGLLMDLRKPRGAGFFSEAWK